MLHLIFGKDTYRALNRLEEIKNNWREKEPASGVFEFSSDNFSFEEFENLVKGQSLIHRNFLVLSRGVLEDKENKNFILPLIGLMGSSPDVFVFCEESLANEVAEDFKKAKAKIEKFELLKAEKLKSWFKEEAQKRKLKLNPEQEFALLHQFGGQTWAIAKTLDQLSLGYIDGLGVKESINLFHFVDAVLEGRRRKALALFYKAAEQGIELEEIFAKIWWGFKALYLILSSKNPENTGLHPYVVQKYKPLSRLFAKEKLEECFKRLIFIQEKSRLGWDLALELEYFILTRQP